MGKKGSHEGSLKKTGFNGNKNRTYKNLRNLATTVEGQLQH